MKKIKTTQTASGTYNQDSYDKFLDDLMISLLSNFFDQDPINIGIAQLVNIINQPELMTVTDKIRSLRDVQYDEHMPADVRMKAKSEADKQKRQTPMVITDTLVEHGKTRKNIRRYNSTRSVDVDHVSKARVAELMEILRQDPHVVFAQPSSSDRGVHAIVRTDVDDFLNANLDSCHVKANSFVWEKVRQHYEPILGECFDEKCKNPEHAFALCYDERTYINLNAEPLHIDTSDFQKKGSKPKAKRSDKAQAHVVGLKEVVKSIEAELDKQNCRPEEGQRNDYVYRFAAICNNYGVDSQEVEQYCTDLLQSDDFTAEEILQTVHSAYTNEEAHGTRKKKARYATHEELVELMNLHGEWRYNEVSKKYEVKPTGEEGWRSCRDEDINNIYCQALKDMLLTNPRQIETIIHSDYTKSYNPITEFINSLPQCTLLDDGRCLVEGREEARDYIGEVADRLHTTSPTEEVRYYFRKWIVQTLKSWIVPGEKNELVFGLLGAQGIYKTTFFRYLLPDILRAQYFAVKTTNGQFDKDEMLKMCSSLIFLLEEFDEMTPRELNQFKATDSLPVVDIRRPYAHNSVPERRLCSFGLTGNQQQVLTDSTGERRFAPFWALSIDCPQENPIDYEAFYAQVLALAKPDSGFISYIPLSELPALNERNKAFSVPIIEHEVVDHFLAIPHGVEKGVLETVGIITAKLQNYTSRQLLDKRKVASYLRERGFYSKRSKKANGNITFYVRYMLPDEIQSKSNMECPLPDDVA